MNENLTIDGLEYRIRRSPRRKTIGVTIDRDGSLILHAPLDCPQDTLISLGREKSFWVHTKLAERELRFRRRRPYEYVSGESFYYLGRNYRLLLVDPDPENPNAPPLRLHEGRFKLARTERDRAQERFQDWYVVHGQPWIERRAGRLTNRVRGIARGRDCEGPGISLGIMR